MGAMPALSFAAVENQHGALKPARCSCSCPAAAWQRLNLAPAAPNPRCSKLAASCLVVPEGALLTYALRHMLPPVWEQELARLQGARLLTGCSMAFRPAAVLCCAVLHAGRMALHPRFSHPTNWILWIPYQVARHGDASAHVAP